MTVFVFDVPETKVIVGHRGQSRCMHALYILNNRMSNRPYE